MSLPLVLASTSPRRQELLRSIALPFELYTVEVDEAASGTPDEVVQVLARRKARAAANALPSRRVLSADTLVWAQGETLGKPKDAQDAKRMLRLLSGGVNRVYTGICLIDGETGRELCDVAETLVYFDPISEEEIDAYIASGEPFGKAGAYAVQGRAGQFVHRVEGSYSNVVGLPLHCLRRMLHQLDR